MCYIKCYSCIWMFGGLPYFNYLVGAVARGGGYKVWCCCWLVRV